MTKGLTFLQRIGLVLFYIAVIPVVVVALLALLPYWLITGDDLIDKLDKGLDSTYHSLITPKES